VPRKPRDPAPELTTAKYKGKPPGGKRPTAAEQERRFQAVRAAMVMGYSKGEILAALQQAGLGTMPERTLDDYMKRVRDAWKAEFAAEWATRRERQLRAIQSHIVKAVAVGKWDAVGTLERLKAQIEGNLAPVVFEQKQPGRGWDQLKDDELEELRTKGKLPDGVSVEDLDRAN
jgi:hypothetical protein